MRIFIDECVNRKLLVYLSGYDFTYIRNTPWRGTKNGALLRLVQDEYDVFLTADRHLPDQHNLQRFDLIFVILRGVSNKLDGLLPLVPDMLATLEEIRTSEPDAGIL